MSTIESDDEKLVREARERADNATRGRWFDYVAHGEEV